MNTSIEQTVFRVALRIQAKRPPPRSIKEWEAALLLASIEMQSKVKLVLDTFFITNQNLRVDTRLADKCSPNLCAEIKSTIIITPSLSPEMEMLVKGTLRQWLYDNDKYYAAIGANVNWISPNVFAILIEWKVEGIFYALDSLETSFFVDIVKEYLQREMETQSLSFDSALVLRQFPASPHNIKIQGFILGTSLENFSLSNCQNQILKSFNAENNSTLFLHELSTSIPAFQQAVDIKASLLTLNELSSAMPSSSPLSIFTQPPSMRNLPFTINTTKVAVILAIMAIGMILCGSGLVIVRKIGKKKVDASLEHEADQDTPSEDRPVEHK